MVNFDPAKFTNDKVRAFQLITLAGVGLFSLLTAITNSKWLQFLLLLSMAGLAFFSIVPVYLATLDADQAPLSRAGRVALKGAECAGVAGVGLVIVILFEALSNITEKYGPGKIGSMLLIQAVVGVGIAAGVGLSNLLRHQGVELEAPAPPPAAYPQQGYDPAQQQYQQQQYQQQQQPWQGGPQGGQGQG